MFRGKDRKKSPLFEPCFSHQVETPLFESLPKIKGVPFQNGALLTCGNDFVMCVLMIESTTSYGTNLFSFLEICSGVKIRGHFWKYVRG